MKLTPEVWFSHSAVPWLIAETIADFRKSERLDMDDRTESLIRSLKRSGSEYSEVFIRGPEVQALGPVALPTDQVAS